MPQAIPLSPGHSIAGTTVASDCLKQRERERESIPVPSQDLALGNWVERRPEAGLVLKIGSCGSMWLEMAGPFDNLYLFSCWIPRAFDSD